MDFLNRFRRAPEQPDEFKAEVLELVRMHGPADALERDAADRLATDVLVRGLLRISDRRALGEQSAGVPHSSPFGRTLKTSVAAVVGQARETGDADAALVGRMISAACLSERRDQPFLDTGEIIRLVGTAYAVAGEILAMNPDMARRFVLGSDALQSEDARALSPLEMDLWRALVEYGSTSDERLVGTLSELYLRAIEEIPAAHRLQLLLYLVEEVEKRRLSGNALLPFIFQDTDVQVVSTAALHAAGVWPGSDQDPMTGVRELASFAHRHALDGDESRAAAMFAGLALLGDRRVIGCIGPCWRSLSTEGRNLLAQGIRGRSYAGVIDWLVTWLEECEGGEFGSVAAALARIPMDSDAADVVDVHRTIPVWVAEDAVIRVTERWTLDAYAERIRPRLLQIAADEQAPRVMHDVLREWGIDHTMRRVAGIVMRMHGEFGTPRPLLPPLGAVAAGPSSVIDDHLPLTDEDFTARDGRVLLSWAIFNPFGPTWSCLGLLPSEDPAVQCLFYRILNPFQQRSGIVGVVRADDCSSGAVLGQLVESLFALDALESASDDPVYLIGGGVPDVLHVVWEEPEFHQAVRRAFFGSPRLRELDMVRAIREIHEFRGRPWDRASAQLRDALAHPTPDGFDVPLERDGEVTDESIDEWLGLITHPDHWVGELLHFPGAWHGSIDNSAPALAQTAFTFWQLDDFLARYGDPTFRLMAEALERPGTSDSD